jgi:hypothetical protein
MLKDFLQDNPNIELSIQYCIDSNLGNHFKCRACDESKKIAYKYIVSESDLNAIKVDFETVVINPLLTEYGLRKDV